VDIFRRPEAVPPIVDEAIAIKAKAVWMQLGIVNEEAAAKARAAGIEVVMDKCMKIEYRRLKR
jgi:predicted CoA-binding protein